MQVFSISYLISCPHFKIQLSLIHATEKIILLDSGEKWPSDYTSSITHDLYSSVQFFSPPFPKYSSINSCKNLGSVILQGIFKPWWHCRHRVNPPCLAIHAQTNPMHPQMCKCFVHKINKHTQCALCKSVCVDIYMYIIMHYLFFFYSYTYNFLSMFPRLHNWHYIYFKFWGFISISLHVCRNQFPKQHPLMKRWSHNMQCQRLNFHAAPQIFFSLPTNPTEKFQQYSWG